MPASRADPSSHRQNWSFMLAFMLRNWPSWAFSILLIIYLILPDSSQSQIRVGEGAHHANLVFQFGPPASPQVWFILSFSEDFITSAEALERIHTSHPEFSFGSENWGSETSPNLFLRSITWQGLNLRSENLFDESNQPIGGNYWGVFTVPDEGIDSTPPLSTAPTGLPQDSDWQESWYGISQRILRDGYWDGYVYQFVSSSDWIYHQHPSIPYPSIQSLAFQTNGAVQLTWIAAPGAVYAIQSTDNLSIPFVTRSTRTASSSKEMWTDPKPELPSKRFYRIEVARP
jgi:hypothetical protein